MPKKWDGVNWTYSLLHGKHHAIRLDWGIQIFKEWPGNSLDLNMNVWRLEKKRIRMWYRISQSWYIIDETEKIQWVALLPIICHFRGPKNSGVIFQEPLALSMIFFNFKLLLLRPFYKMLIQPSKKLGGQGVAIWLLAPLFPLICCEFQDSGINS